MHGRRLLLILLACLALPAGLALADGEDDTTFDGDGAVYLSTGASDNDIVYAGQPMLARASDGDLLVGAVVNRPSKSRNARGATFDVELRVYKIDDDGGLDDTWGGGDGIASALSETFGNTASDALAVYGLPGGGAVLVAEDSGTPGLMAARYDANGTGVVAKRDGPDGCNGTPSLAEAGVNAEFFAFWDNACFGPADGSCSSSERGDDCDNIARSRYQHYEWTTTSTISEVGNDPRGIPLRPLGNELFIDDVAVGPAGVPSVLGGMDILLKTRGTSDGGPVIMRFDADDDPDSTLDGDGVRPLDEEAFESSYTGRFGLRPGGGYVVAYDEASFGRAGGTVWELARFDADGTLDDTFGDGGLAAPDHEAFTCPYPHSVRVLPDERVLLFRDRWDDNPCAPAAVTARTTATGALDSAFGTGGVRTFDFGQQNSNLQSENGDPLPLPDGRVVLPFLLNYYPNAPRRVDPPAGNGQYFALFRLKGPPQQEEEQKSTTQQQSAVAIGAVPAVAPPPVVVPSRRCTSRRSLRIRLRTGRSKSEQSRIVSAVVTVNGKRVNPRRNGATVNLRNLPKGRYSVVIRLRLADGGRVRDVRRYRTCAPKVERELAPLRTRKPR